MCPTLWNNVAAATAAVDYDFMTNVTFKPYARGKTARKVTHIALTGSDLGKVFPYKRASAAGDTRFTLKYGSDIIGYFYNTATGLGVNQIQDMQPVADGRWCSPDAVISLICDDAATTNAIGCMMYIVEAKGRSR